MNCIICAHGMSPHFSKRFDGFGLDVVHYWRCPSCGFNASKTHFDMDEEAWSRLNGEFHAANNARDDNPHKRNQRYFHQALMLHLMARHGLVDPGRWLDWGSGPGHVSIQLSSHFGGALLNFDQHIEPVAFRADARDLVPRWYDLVLNTAVFEHVRGRDTLDEIESYAHHAGCLAVHTLVRGEIPPDPEWMYLLPVHCAFHTNRSMQLLLEQWGYTCSTYNVEAKTWVFFKGDPHGTERAAEALNRLMGWEYLHFKRGFVDYWP